MTPLDGLQSSVDRLNDSMKGFFLKVCEAFELFDLMAYQRREPHFLRDKTARLIMLDRRAQ